MQTVQLKLESIPSIVENQQADSKNSKGRSESPVQFVIPAPENLMRSRAMFFSPKHGKVACFHILFFFGLAIVSFDIVNISTKFFFNTDKFKIF